MLPTNFNTDDQQSEQFKIAKLNRGSENGDNDFGIEFAKSKWQDTLPKDTQWVFAPHPTNELGEDTALLLQKINVIPLAVFKSWHITVTMPDAMTEVTIAHQSGIVETIKAGDNHFNLRFANGYIKPYSGAGVKLNCSGSVKLLCLAREICDGNVPFEIHFNGTNSQRISEIVGGDKKPGTYYKAVAERLAVISRGQLPESDFILPLKVSPKKVVMDKGWVRAVEIGLSDDDIYAIKRIKTLDQFNQSPYTSLLLTANEIETRASLAEVAEQWLIDNDNAIVNKLKNSVLANYFNAVASHRYFMEDSVKFLMDSGFDPVAAFEKTGKLSNVKQLTA